MKRAYIASAVVIVLGGFWGAQSLSFCGFFVARAPAKLLNKSSQVILVRDGTRTVLTMANDYQGEPKDFALVVPVPQILKQEDIRIADASIFQTLDEYSGPRLVEYFDEDPCEPLPTLETMVRQVGIPGGALEQTKEVSGVKVEAKFTVGEYDIVILSAEDSRGLEKWLRINGYKIPQGAAELFRPYILQNLYFFVAKVNLEEHARLGSVFLRPIQMTYESERYMLPIRLGMLNADGPQELVIYHLTKKGRVETTNYRMVKMPAEKGVPLFVQNEFTSVYQAIVNHQYHEEGRNAVFLEYAWNMAMKCDPCTGDYTTLLRELPKAGVGWLPEFNPQSAMWGFPTLRLYFTRMRVRYTRDKFPEDLMFMETSNLENFQVRYIMRHPYTGTSQCEARREYEEKVLPARYEEEAKNLAELTGWKLEGIRKKMELKPRKEPWWRTIFQPMP